ncbi:hypothetical protein KCP69_19185 [Salmonella enterica subsp. enterica]|nr:hypothetical protein KCP69_19185 [Salmonella enterica subsp. enterica]
MAAALMEYQLLLLPPRVRSRCHHCGIFIAATVVFNFPAFIPCSRVMCRVSIKYQSQLRFATSAFTAVRFSLQQAAPPRHAPSHLCCRPAAYQYPP